MYNSYLLKTLQVARLLAVVEERSHMHRHVLGRERTLIGEPILGTRTLASQYFVRRM